MHKISEPGDRPLPEAVESGHGEAPLGSLRV